MKNIKSIVVLAVSNILILSGVHAAPQDPIMIQGESVVTQQEFDARISKIPSRDRAAFLMDGERAKKILQTLMMNQRIADDAKKSGFADDPNIQVRLKLAMVHELSAAYLDYLEKQKSNAANFELMAKEYYLTNKAKYTSEPSIDVAHILIGVADRSTKEALSLANELYTQLINDPTLWGKYVLEYTDDSGSRGNGGTYIQVVRGKMVKSFENKAFSMEAIGEISKPVQTNYGFHIIRLDKKHPVVQQSFDAVKDKLVTQMRSSFTKKARNNYISHINMRDEVIIPECALDEMLTRYYKDDKTTSSYKACLANKNAQSNSQN